MASIDNNYHTNKMTAGYKYITYAAYLNPESMRWEGQGGRYSLSLRSSRHQFLITRPGWLEVYKTVSIKSLLK